MSDGVTLAHKGGRLVIVLPNRLSRQRNLGWLPLSVFAVAWVLVSIMLFTGSLRNSAAGHQDPATTASLYLQAWCWFVAGPVAFYVWLAVARGRTRITVSQNEITVDHTVLGLRRSYARSAGAALTVRMATQGIQAGGDLVLAYDGRLRVIGHLSSEGARSVATALADVDG